MAYGLIVTLLAWALLWSVGEATARALFGPRCDHVVASARLPLGVAAALCLLEGAGYFLPIRMAAWLLIPVGAFGATRLLQRAWKRRGTGDSAVAVASLVGLTVGLVPVFIAGHFTAAAITNNDGSYYLTTAEWLVRVPWRFQYPTYESIPPSLCLTERVLHGWMWRTGTPNLMAAVMGLSGLPSPAALAVVTAVLMGAVPCSAIGVARSLGVRRNGTGEGIVGLCTAASAAPAFLAFQHMTGHLGAEAMFPATCAATIAAGRYGGLRRLLHAALFCGASFALFADGGSVLVVIGLSACVARPRRLVRTVLSVAGVAALTVAVVPFTIERAVRAGLTTAINVSNARDRVVFPQRGWLPRTVLDDLGTIVGVDPWPPWPAARPPNAPAVLAGIAALCGAFLLIRGARSVRTRLRSWAPAVLLSTLALVGVLVTPVRYLEGKILLTVASLAVPLCGVGAAALSGGRRYWFLLPFALGELSALRELSRPSRWKVVDTPAHDALVAGLAKLPRGSVLAFDGLGAPADAVLDAHRAHRAALLADLRPVQPGLDGGFYLPKFCADLPRQALTPPKAYALQRITSETLTVGAEMDAWGPFRLLEVDLASPEAFVAAWAPTHGWLAAEREPNGRVFRWGESSTQGTLHAVTAAPCARLRGEVRVVRGGAFFTIEVEKDNAYSGSIGPDWSPFETRAFPVLDPAVLRFQVSEVAAPPPDAAHAFALSHLALEPTRQCGSVAWKDEAAEPSGPRDVAAETELTVGPPAGAPCYRVWFTVTADSGESLRVQVDGSPRVWLAVDARTHSAAAPILSGETSHRIRVAPPAGRTLHLLDVAVRPGSCVK